MNVESLEDQEAHHLGELAIAIQRTSEVFRAEPASFLFEADLRSLLFARAFDGLAQSTYLWPADEVSLASLTPGVPLRVNPVKAEYKYGASTRRRFDVAVLSPRRVKDKAWNQHAWIGVEIKFWQADGTGHKFEGDRDRLHGYLADAEKAGRRFTGICLVFCHKRNEKRIETWGKSLINLGSTLPSIRPGQVTGYLITP